MLLYYQKNVKKNTKSSYFGPKIWLTNILSCCHGSYVLSGGARLCKYASLRAKRRRPSGGPPEGWARQVHGSLAQVHDCSMAHHTT